MLRHIIKIYFRDLLKNKSFTLINFVGIAIALSCAFLILLYVINETSFDSFHKNKDRIYRQYVKFEWGVNQEGILASSSFLMRDALLNDMPEIENVTRIYDYSLWGDKQLVQKGEEFIYEPEFKLVDNDFFDMFSYQIINGEISNPLKSRESLLISEKASARYFPNSNPIGKVLFIKNNLTEELFEIVGVFEDIPANSTFQADFIGSIDVIDDVYLERGWNPTNMQTYFMLSENATPEELQTKFDQLPDKYHPDTPYSYKMQILKDIYFNSDFFSWYFQKQGDKKHVYMFSIIAFLIVLVASINYIILSTAKGIGRNIEIGMRKVVGASRKMIIRQIRMESILFLFLIFPLAVMLSELILPVMNRLLSRELVIEYFHNWHYLLGLLLITTIVGLLSGSYISIFLSRFQPEDILKKKFTSKFGKSILRKGLMIIQLIVFIILFIFAGIIYKQLVYIQDHDLGYSTENLLVVQPPHDHDLTDCSPFVQSIENYSGIENVSQVASGIFTTLQAAQNFYNPQNSEDELAFRLFLADYNFLETFGMELLEGRWFDPDKSADFDRIIINETAVKKLNLTGQKPMYLGLDESQVEVIGVIKDFNVQSLHSAVQPLAIMLKQEEHMLCQIAVKTHKNTDIQTVLSYLKKNWEDSGPKGMFEYYFFDDKVNELYQDDKNFGDTLRLFSILIIIIALLGLFGYSLFNAKQRNKEVGIRKAFGASPQNILSLLSKDFLLLTFLANLIAWPIAYKLASGWLAGFAFQIQIPILIFFLALVVSSITVFVIMFINGIRVANQNPTVTLRYE